MVVKGIVLSWEWKTATSDVLFLRVYCGMWKPTYAYIAELAVEFGGLKLRGQVELGGGDSSTSGGPSTRLILLH
jgi:hypothetical protein